MLGLLHLKAMSPLLWHFLWEGKAFAIRNADRQVLSFLGCGKGVNLCKAHERRCADDRKLQLTEKEAAQLREGEQAA